MEIKWIAISIAIAISIGLICDAYIEVAKIECSAEVTQE